MKELTQNEIILIKDKYIFHGSQRLLTKLLAHQAKCSTNAPANTHNAIYGASDVRDAVLHALARGGRPIDPSKDASWSAFYDTHTAVLDNIVLNDDTQGYVYCLNKKTFKPTEKGSGQYVSVVTQKPEKVYIVKYKNFKELFKLK